MTAATSRLRRRGIGAGVAALVGLSGLGFAAMPAQAAVGFNPAANQVSGVDRFDTAAQIATKAFPGGSQTVVVANGDRAIDAQAGAYAAGLNNAPILLTQKSNVPAYTVNAIKTLGATKAIVLGDSNSVDATALAQMTAAGLQVQVVSGTDRFATAAAIYNLGSTKSSTVFLARADLLAGQVSPDALAASPLSFDGTPVLLTNAGSLPSATANAITSGGVKNVVVLGNAITDSVKNAVTALGATVTTIAGDDRSLTAQKIAEYGVQQGKYSNTAATIANGDKIDALAAGPWAAKNKAPILLTLGTNALGTGTSNYLTANAATLTSGVAFGDTNSVPASLTTAAQAAANGTATGNQKYTFAPTGNQLKTISAGSNNAGVQQYTVSGLGTTPVNIALVTPGSVKSDGTFTVATGASTATLTAATVGAITVVNGVGNGSANTASNITPVNGAVTFTVDSTTAGSAVPVVFSAADGNSTLSVSSAGVASEAYGIGGQITWLPAEASAGTISTTQISAVDKTAGYVVAGSVYKWKSGDTFQLDLGASGVVNTSQADFLARVSAGDNLSGSYSTTGASNFILADLAPVQPGSVTVAAGTTASTSATVTIADSSTASVASYNVYRAAVAGSGTAPTSLSSYTKVGSVADGNPGSASGTAVTFSDTGLSPSTRYFYAVTSVDSTGQEGSAFATSSAYTSGAVAAATAPKSSSIAYNDGNANARLDTNDVITATFDQAVTVGSTWAINLIDGAGNAATISNSNATATVNSAGNVLTVSLTSSPQITTGAGPLVLSGGSNPGVEVLNATGLGNTTGNWNVAGSGDRTISGTAPAALVAADVTLGASTIAVAAGTNTPLAASTEYLVRVYNTNGVVQAFRTVTTASDKSIASGNLVTTQGGSTTAALAAGDYLVTYQPTANGGGFVSQGVTKTRS